jgi:type IV secretory pathway TrbL component
MAMSDVGVIDTFLNTFTTADPASGRMRAALSPAGYPLR